ncbi:hypothetical protein LIN78_03885 [Leeia sp. TBRC 13508]|uniref:Uncharacterized protein n=1 Tax=Leeia speluncae TaxID=2884804 RepID=A0ABS8D3B8_9NEIS|nr:hypothetical protein [Leeia speluncae]MCB6182693.1 hypothetical protein [Leeia speluncae]
MFSIYSIRRVFIGALFALHLAPAMACEQTDTPKNQIGSLPASLKSKVPQNMGVEQVSLTTLANGSKMAAAILTPKKWFVPCGMDELAANDPLERVLVVWQQLETQWEQVGRNSQMLYSIDTAGETNLQLAWTKGQLRVRQDMAANSALTADQFILQPNPAKKQINISAWTSTALDDPACCGNGDEAMFNKLDAAKAKYGEDKVCEKNGYAGTINYATGKVDINRCEYAKPKRSVSNQSSVQVIELTQFKPVPFDQQKGLPK